MKIRLLLSIIFVFTFLLTHAQKKELSLAENVNKETISFQFIKNLVVVPITFNGHQMNFIVDSGLKETILFSQYDKTINKNNLRQINLKGLGKDNADTKGFFSSKNQIVLGQNYSSNNMDIIVIQEENFNLFSRLGIEVHGIIGSEFFKNYPIQIDYAKRKITIYKSILEVKKLKKFQSNPLEISPEIKPFTTVDFTHQTTYTDQKMLIDIGNSDGLWLFENQIENLAPLQHVFSDELGKGFNGSINGKRGVIDAVNLDKYKLNQPLIAIPDIESIQYLNFKNNRKGSIGNEILRRFTIILDYKNQLFYYKPNRNFKDAFHYNRSGLTIIHDQFEWKKTSIGMTFNTNDIDKDNGTTTQKMNYKFEMKPIYKIEAVRKKSNADLVGLKANDILTKLDGKQVNKMSLDDIEKFMIKNEFQQISVEILRNNVPMKFKFILDIPY
ncbi:aspartyl protease family protein [Empedobacter falsenii]|uniref:aspartyl protease family protein n=1 Tax=Empedobacter falsenii TaxID=343874 RepID=UPI0025787ACA|nr:aspartyl protease family protein [Empedobacter falsenii]MDM1299138.1 aspartyl protease family protein [Empedobacter falsenii]MDM1318927.1 aspartyl protease family protein [Empedobacter falsenii]